MFSLCQQPRRRLSSACDEKAIRKVAYPKQEEILGVQAALATSLGPGVAMEVQRSLWATRDEVAREFPGDAEDMGRTRARTFSYLSEFMEGVNAPAMPSAHSQMLMKVAQDTLGTMEQLPKNEVGGDGGGLTPLLESPTSRHSLSSLANRSACRDHEEITRSLYEAQGLDFSLVQQQSRQFLKALGLRPLDVGVKTFDEKGHMLLNQCFYLSIAHSFLGHTSTREKKNELALHLKRAIETAVLSEHPHLAYGLDASSTGECEAMVFADFLPIAMHVKDSPSQANPTAKLAVCILDSVGGHVEVYLGPRYADLPSTAEKERNLVLVWYVPGHYQCLVRDDRLGSQLAMTYDDFKALLVEHGVVYVETLE